MRFQIKMRNLTEIVLQATHVPLWPLIWRHLVHFRDFCGKPNLKLTDCLSARGNYKIYCSMWVLLSASSRTDRVRAKTIQGGMVLRRVVY